MAHELPNHASSPAHRLSCAETLKLHVWNPWRWAVCLKHVWTVRQPFYGSSLGDLVSLLQTGSTRRGTGRCFARWCSVPNLQPRPTVLVPTQLAQVITTGFDARSVATLGVLAKCDRATASRAVTTVALAEARRRNAGIIHDTARRQFRLVSCSAARNSLHCSSPGTSERTNVSFRIVV